VTLLGLQLFIVVAPCSDRRTALSLHVGRKKSIPIYAMGITLTNEENGPRGVTVPYGNTGAIPRNPVSANAVNGKRSKTPVAAAPDTGCCGATALRLEKFRFYVA
jgi:hypothetical protein